MRADLIFNPLPTRRKWVIEAAGLRTPAEFRAYRLTWTWPTGETFKVEFSGTGIDIYQDGKLRVGRVVPQIFKGHLNRRWEFDGTAHVERATGCRFRSRVENGPLVLWVRAGFGLNHPLVYPP